ncbi:MAG: hypothetical protein IT428_05840 [Planctomycetaceae bacterium]|nr:hypothetical protein [Planctomycetaceae bacterium]
MRFEVVGTPLKLKTDQSLDHETGPPTILDTDATVFDPDSAQLSGGNLTVRLTANAQSTDRLGIRHEGTGPGQIEVDGSNGTFGGTVIETVAGGGLPL